MAKTGQETCALRQQSALLRRQKFAVTTLSLLAVAAVAHGAAATFSLRALPGAALQRSSRLLMSAIVVPTPPAPFVSVDRHSACSTTQTLSMRDTVL